MGQTNLTLPQLLNGICHKLNYDPSTGKNIKSQSKGCTKGLVSKKGHQNYIEKLIHKSIKSEVQKAVKSEIQSFFSKPKQEKKINSLMQEKLEKLLQRNDQSIKDTSLEELNDVLEYYENYSNYLKKHDDKDSLNKLQNLHELAQRVHKLGSDLLTFTYIFHLPSDHYKDATPAELEIAYEKTPSKFVDYMNWETELDPEKFQAMRSQSSLIIEYILNEPIYLLNKKKAIYSLITGRQDVLGKDELAENMISSSKLGLKSTNVLDNLPYQDYNKKDTNKLVDTLYYIVKNKSTYISLKDQANIVKNLSYVINSLVFDTCLMVKRDNAIKALKMLPKIFDNVKRSEDFMKQRQNKSQDA